MYAFYRVQPSWGYTIEIMNNDDVIEIYTAGNHTSDSQIYDAYGENRISYNALCKFARQTAREMLIEFGYPKGLIIYNSDL